MSDEPNPNAVINAARKLNEERFKSDEPKRLIPERLYERIQIPKQIITEVLLLTRDEAKALLEYVEDYLEIIR